MKKKNNKSQNMAKKIIGRKDPKEYMKLAVEVMKKSIPERKKKKPSPYVGAVLVFPNGTIDTAYRGEQKEGNHASPTIGSIKVFLNPTYLETVTSNSK